MLRTPIPQSNRLLRQPFGDGFNGGSERVYRRWRLRTRDSASIKTPINLDRSPHKARVTSLQVLDFLLLTVSSWNIVSLFKSFVSTVRPKKLRSADAEPKARFRDRCECGDRCQQG